MPHLCVCKEREEEEKNILFIPRFLFLFFLQHEITSKSRGVENKIVVAVGKKVT